MKTTLNELKTIIKNIILEELENDDDFDIPLPVLRVQSYMDIPRNFTGIVKYNDKKYWYKDGELHREDGPAVEYPNGHKVWYKNGKRHREDGPAVIWADGSKEYWLNDEEYSKKQYDEIIKNKNFNEDVVNEEYLGTRGGVHYFQMGGSLPDHLYNRKDGKPSREVGIAGFKRGKSSSEKLEKSLKKKKHWYQKEED